MKKAAILGAVVLFTAVYAQEDDKTAEVSEVDPFVADDAEDVDAEVDDAEADDEDEMSKAFNPAHPEPEWLKYAGTVVGIVAGWYGPWTQRARNYDCFSETLAFGDALNYWY